MDGTTVDTIITESETITQNITIPQNDSIATTTPSFTWVPVDGTTLTLDVGSTYLYYGHLSGGFDVPVATSEFPSETSFSWQGPDPTCVSSLTELGASPTETGDYHFFMESYTGNGSIGNTIPTLPPQLLDYIKDMPIVTSNFNGSDLATCTPVTTPPSQAFPTQPLSTCIGPGCTTLKEPPKETGTVEEPVFSTVPETSTYISKTYESTSTHVTRQGCLRCSKTENPQVTPGLVPEPSQDPPPTDPNRSQEPPGDLQRPTPQPSQISPPKDPQQSKAPDNQQRPHPSTDLAGLIATIINDPQFTQGPQPQERPGDQVQSITIGDSVMQVRPAQPTKPSQPNDPTDPNAPIDPADPEQQEQQNPGVVIGSQTLTPGQTTTINGVQVIVPTQGGGSRILVDGSTVAVNSVPTGPPVLTLGENRITANPQGEFVVGTQTLTPGGPVVTVSGTVLSVGPSGTIAVINGVTQTLANAPHVTQAPVLTVDGKPVSATVVGGTTQFVLTDGQTLTPGGIITVDGTTFSMPTDGAGSTVVVNGVTSTLNAPGLPVITVDSQSITATVVDGTTAFVLSPSQTLTPGGVLTVSGTTYSMPASASGSVVVINGVTSTIGGVPITSAPALTIDGKTYSATVRDGTTEYVLGKGTTLKPGEAITISGTIYSLDQKGTALIINGKTSSIPKTPARNSATTTKSSSKNDSTKSTTTQREPGDFVASGIGISNKPGSAVSVRGGLDFWLESVMISIAGWVLLLV